MKALLLILLGGLGLGAVYWKTQHPEATVVDLKTQATATATRLKSGFEAVRDGGPTGQERDAAMTSRIDDLEQRLGANQEAATLTSTADSENGAALESRLTSAESRLAESETKLNDALARLNEADTQLAETQNLLTANEATQQESQAASSNLQATVDARIRANADKITAAEGLKPELTRMAKENDAISVKLDALDNRVNLIVRRLDEQTLDASITELSKRLDEVDGTITELTESNDQVSAQIQTEIARVTESADTLNSRINTLASGVNTENDDAVDADALSAVKASIDQRFQSMESKLTTVNTDSLRLANLGKELEATREKLKVLESEKTETATKIAALDTSVEELKTAGESLSIDTVQADIRQQLSSLQSQVDSEAGKMSMN